MDLPVRVRQLGPPRSSVEVTRTIDVSRNGVLFRTRERYFPDSTVWVTMPYSQDSVVPEPEFPATVVRILPASEGGSDVAVQFHSSRADQFRPVYQYTPPAAPARSTGRTERREKNRVRMSLPIRVRIERAAEESMTIDVSRTGVLFRSAQNYPVGQKVWVTMPYEPAAPAQEVPARVVRVVDQPQARGIALHFGGAEAPAGPPRSFYSR